MRTDARMNALRPSDSCPREASSANQAGEKRVPIVPTRYEWYAVSGGSVGLVRLNQVVSLKQQSAGWTRAATREGDDEDSQSRPQYGRSYRYHSFIGRYWVISIQ